MHTNPYVNPARSPEPVYFLSRGIYLTKQRYVVAWPDGIVKVGCTMHGRKRWGTFLARGGSMIDLAFYGPGAFCSDAEAWLQWELLRHGFKSAFNAKEEAADRLGCHGAGYSECFKVPLDRMDEVLLLARAD